MDSRRTEKTLSVIVRLSCRNARQGLSAEKAMVFMAGPRQSGKTTLAQIIADEHANQAYFNWDIPTDRIRLIKQPFFFETLYKMLPSKIDSPLSIPSLSSDLKSAGSRFSNCRSQSPVDSDRGQALRDSAFDGPVEISVGAPGPGRPADKPARWLSVDFQRWPEGARRSGVAAACNLSPAKDVSWRPRRRPSNLAKIGTVFWVHRKIRSFPNALKILRS
ncbi:MAG: hypothetical protein U5R30_07035 [Deltaproteobacteria bacterium]|nr:hypothetical protein [Deltaproteobacteria bacterium]